MASDPITSWQIDRETVDTVTDFIFLGSKIVADGDCSHEIKRRLLLGRKAMANLDSILKSRDITLPTKVCLVKAVIFLVVMYECESWTIRKAKGRKIDAFELWCWRRSLWVSWTAVRSNQSILKKINPAYSLEGLMLKLKFQYFGYLMQRTNSWKYWCWEILKAGGEGDDRGWDGWMASPTQWAWVWASSGRWWRTGKPGVLQSMGSQRVRHDWATSLSLSNYLILSVIPFSSCPQSFPASGSFPMSQLFATGGQGIGASASASVLPMSIQGWYPSGLTGFIFLQSKGLSRVFSSTTI